MLTLSPDAGGMEHLFWLCAVGGTVFFLLRVLLVVVIGFGDHDLSAAHDVGVDGHIDSGDVHAYNTDAAFKLLSINSISAFIMMFGWAGLTALKQHQLPQFAALVIATLVGLGMMALTSYIFLLAQKLTTEGADFRIEKTIGKTAKVYLRIPSGGRGKVQVTVDGLLHEIDAEAEDGREIESFATVEIKRAIGPALVTVAALSQASN